jgi:L-fucose isomerase-like protein
MILPSTGGIMTGRDSALTFAVLYGNRGFFPSELIAEAQEEVPAALQALGITALELERSATRFGAVETPEEGRKFARMLAANRGRYDGVIVSLANFGDENGAVEALRDAGVPILLQAYPDEITKMDPAHRRDAFCGKLSIMDVFRQFQLPFTTLKPHVVHPSAPGFGANLEYFAAVCRAARAGRRMTVGAIGARTTAFKTVRIDELALQRHGITVETIELADVMARMRSTRASSGAFKQARERLLGAGSWDGVPPEALDTSARLAVVLEALVSEYTLDAMSIRCWTELQAEMHISPCVTNGIFAEAGIPVACEVDTGSAVMMRLLTAAARGPSTVLDWNNNWGDDEDLCVIFHCGNVPQSLMRGRGRVTDHAILSRTLGAGCAWGCNQGALATGPFTFGDLATEDGRVKAYLGEGTITEDRLPPEFFGVGGVARITGLQDILLHIGRNGHRHHVAMAAGSVGAAVQEATAGYLGWETTVPQG